MLISELEAAFSKYMDEVEQECISYVHSLDVIQRFDSNGDKDRHGRVA